ncbi:hypothetical protein [Agrobacterium tumefaciens]|nr:hypothetical protein [Agrobacterium tumefaciens]
MLRQQQAGRSPLIGPLARTAVPVRFNRQAIESYGAATGADRA